MAPARPGAGTAPEPSRSEAQSRPVDILEFDIEGNTLLDEVTIDEAVYPFLGPQRARGDIDRARAALERVYLDRGYKTVAVIIPRQTVVRGVVRLQVVEGRVGNLKVVGSKYTSLVRLKEAVPSLAEGNVPDFNLVQSELARLGQGADRTVTPRLRAGAAPGTIDVDLLVDDHLPLHGSAEVNNQYSQNTTELRAIGTLSYNNLFQRGHSLTVSYQASPQNESDASVIYASYLAPLTSHLSLLIDGFHSDSDVSTAGGVDVVGRGQIAEVKGLITLESTPARYQAVTLGVAYKHFNDKTTVPNPDQGPQGFTTPITYFPLSVGYSLLLREPRAQTQLDLTLNFAVPEFGSPASPTQDAGLSNNRSGATGQELYLRANLTRTQELPWGFQGYVRFTGQLTDQPLITNEEFTAGGASSVRGYVEAEALADEGLSGALELRTPQLAPGGLRRLLQDFRVYGFLDGARLRVRNPLPEQAGDYSLMSYGAGANLQIFGFLNGALSWARTVEDGPVTPAGADKFLFRVWVAF